MISPKRNKLEAHRSDLEEAYNSGENLDVLATRYGVALSTIYRFFKKKGTKPNRAHSMDHETERIVELWNSGLSMPMIAKELGISTMPVQRILHKAGILTPRRSKVVGQYEEIAQRYLAKEPPAAIAASLGVSHTTIYDALRAQGIEISHIRTHDINETVFDEPLTPNAKYWLGWLATDGNVYSNNCDVPNQVRISVTDHEVIEQFKQFTGYTGNTTFRPPEGNSKSQSGVSICSQRLAYVAVSHGLVPNKSLILKVSDELASDPDFWAGAICGDGSMMFPHKRGNKYTYIYCSLTSSSPQFAQQFREYVYGITGVQMNDKAHHQKNRNPNWIPTIGGSTAEKFLAHIITHAKNDYFLTHRKWVAAKDFLLSKGYTF